MSEPKRVSEYVDAALEMSGARRRERIELTVANDDQALEVLRILIVARFDFDVGVKRNVSQPTFSVGEDGEPMI